MAIAFTCPSCGKSLQLPDHAAGKTGKCEACGARIAIPADVAVEADSYAVIEPEPYRPTDPASTLTQTPRSPTAEASSHTKHAKPTSSQGVRWGMVLAAGTAALVFVGAAVILLLPAFSAARRKASEAVERQAARDAATGPEPAPQPVAAAAVTVTPLDEAGLPPREADPAIAELETFARDLVLTAIRLRQVIEPVKTLQEAVRVAPEVDRLGKILGSAEERQKAIPTVTIEQAAKIDQKYQDIMTREMAATSKELERYEALAKAPAMKTASPGRVNEMVVQGNTAVPTKSLGAQGAGAAPPPDPLVPAPSQNELLVVSLGSADLPGREEFEKRLSRLTHQMNNGVSSVSGARLADRWVYRVGYAGNPIDFAQKMDFAEIVKVEGRTIELKLNPADAALTASPPNVPDHFLFRPRIETSVGTVRGGTVFAAQLRGDSRAILFTALHVFGPPGGLESEPEAKDLPAAVKKIVLTGLFDPSETVEAGAIVLPLPRAGRLGTQSRSGDVVAILAPVAAKLQPQPVADRSPASGEPVWLAARLLSGAPPDQRLHPATAKGVDEDGLLLYEFENPKTEIRATSGAPVLNAAGEVVAIQAGSAREGEKLIGVGTPVTKFAAELRRVLQQGRQPGMKESPRKNTARTRRRTP